MPAPRLSPAWSVGLLLALLVGVGVLLAGLGSAVLIPQGSMVGVLALGVLLFLGAQLAIFKLFGLRSRADEAAAEDEEPEDDDSDWRAWRG